MSESLFLIEHSNVSHLKKIKEVIKDSNFVSGLMMTVRNLKVQ